MSSEESSGSSGDVTLHTEPGLEEVLGIKRPLDAIPRPDQETVEEYRSWWKQNPRTNLWTTKGSLWPRFEKEVLQGYTPEQASLSGANVLLEDLERTEIPEPSGSGNEAAAAAADDVPSDEVWFGTPDPIKYVPGTNALDREQLEEERAKGNIITLRDLRTKLQQAEDWELQAIAAMMEIQRLKQGTWVQNPETGRYISLWDLYNYVHHNPELKALAERGLNSIGNTRGRQDRLSRIEDLARLSPERLMPNAKAMMLPADLEAALPWGIVSIGQYYSKRPIRWLRGLGGQLDFCFALYAREQEVENVLGGKWRGEDPEKVLADSSYWDQLLEASPVVGMTLMAVAERPLDLQQAQRTWSDAVQQQLDRLASGSHASSSSSTSSLSNSGRPAIAAAAATPSPQKDLFSSGSSPSDLQELVSLFDLERLSESELLDRQGHLRAGSTLWFTAMEDGLLVQAESPGLLKEQKAYLLGYVGDAQLCRALFSLFMHPAHAVDREAAEVCGRTALAMANGYRTSEHRQMLQRAARVAGSQLRPGARNAVWRLPAVGAAPKAAQLVDNVQFQVAAQQLHQAYVDALKAVSEAEDDSMSPQEATVARRAAAEASLQRSFAAMGFNAEGLTIPAPDLSAEVYSLALPAPQPAASR